MKNIDIDIDIDKAILKNIDIDKGIWQNIGINKAIMKNIDIDEISNRLEFCISNRARCEPIVFTHTLSTPDRLGGQKDKGNV